MPVELATKLAILNSTNLTLNDRFTKFTQERYLEENKSKNDLKTPNDNNANVLNIDCKNSLGLHGIGSIENQRLAQQMANRPSVLAALKLKKKSINQQRVGNRKNILNRLTRGPKTRDHFRPFIQNANNIKSRLTRPNQVSNYNKFYRRRNSNYNLNANNMRPSHRANNNGQTHIANRLNKPNYGNHANQRENYKINSVINHNGDRIKRRFGGFTKGLLSKEALDNDLNQYMQKTRANLDKDLDAYMSQSF